MKRLLLGFTLAMTGVLALPALAGAGNDVARGSGASPFFPRDFSFNAQSNFNGTGASGNVTFTHAADDPNTTFKGRVTCLAVIGNTATISGEIVDVQGSSAPLFSTTRSFVIKAVDSGKFGVTPDQVGYVLSAALPPPEPTCIAFQFSTTPILSGDIVIKDANS